MPVPLFLSQGIGYLHLFEQKVKNNDWVGQCELDQGPTNHFHVCGRESLPIITSTTNGFGVYHKQLKKREDREGRGRKKEEGKENGIMERGKTG